MVSKEEMLRMNPADRIKALKRLEEHRKREIREAEKLIHESEQEIEQAEVAKVIPIPQMRSIDPSTLFSKEEEAIFKTHHQQSAHREETRPATQGRKKEDSLEDAVAGAPRAQANEQQGVQYSQKLEQSLGAIYKGLASMSEDVAHKGYLNSAEQEKVELYKNKIEEIHDALGHHPEREGAAGMVYGGLDIIAHMQEKAGYAAGSGGGNKGHNPKYKF